MAKAKTPAVVDTSAGTAAYNLASEHKAMLDPRLPAGTIDNLGADLTILGAPLPPPPMPPGQPPAQPPPAPPAAPTLAEALAAAATLVSAIHGAIRSAMPKSDVRKAYGVSAKDPSKEAKAVLAAGNKIAGRAQANPSEALSLGILPSDVTALAEALASLQAAETAATTKGGKAAGTGAARHAAEVRMHEAVLRIAGAGALAFATNATVRAQFEALRPKKKG